MQVSSVTSLDVCLMVVLISQTRASASVEDNSVQFIINETQLSDAGLYRCVVEDASGQQWNDTDFLFVNGLSLTLSFNLPVYKRTAYT